MFTFNVVITHEIITLQDICMDKIPKDFTSIKDTYYAALNLYVYCTCYYENYGQIQNWRVFFNRNGTLECQSQEKIKMIFLISIIPLIVE